MMSPPRRFMTILTLALALQAGAALSARADGGRDQEKREARDSNDDEARDSSDDEAKDDSGDDEGDDSEDDDSEDDEIDSPDGPSDIGGPSAGSLGSSRDERESAGKGRSSDRPDDRPDERRDGADGAPSLNAMVQALAGRYGAEPLEIERRFSRGKPIYEIILIDAAGSALVARLDPATGEIISVRRKEND